MNNKKQHRKILMGRLFNARHSESRALFELAKLDGILKENGCLAKTDRIIQIENKRRVDCNDDMLGTLMEYYKYYEQ